MSFLPFKIVEQQSASDPDGKPRNQTFDFVSQKKHKTHRAALCRMKYLSKKCQTARDKQSQTDATQDRRGPPRLFSLLLM